MSNFIGVCLIVIGLLFNIVGSIGLVRLPDIYNRLQAATKCVTLGTCMFLIGGMVLTGTPAGIVKCLICMIFILITSPTAAHALSRGAHASGVKLWEKSVSDSFEVDNQPGIDKRSTA
jgi:multicomponent Na+:H+ antiporter subunit G